MGKTVFTILGVCALVAGLTAGKAGATSLTYTTPNDVKITVRGIPAHSGFDINSLNTLFNSFNGLKGGSNGSIQDVLNNLKFDPKSIKVAENILSTVIGKPIHVSVAGPGVSPIPEPRTWLLYAFGAAIGAWALRKQLTELR